MASVFETKELGHLLDEVRELVPPPAWLRVERALKRVITLYGTGLAHLLEHARETGASQEALDRKLDADELLGSLLVLHGLHPLTTEQRVVRALDAVRTELGLGDDAIVLHEITGAQSSAGPVVRLEAIAGLGGGSMSTRVAAGIVRRAIEAAAPEVSAVEIAGLPKPRAPGLVTLRVRREVT
jgi:hypothetical protein